MTAKPKKAMGRKARSQREEAIELRALVETAVRSAPVMLATDEIKPVA